MKFVEFLVFLCRIAFEHYRNTPYESELMYLKLEKMIPVFLAPINLVPLFLFYEEFEYKPQAKKSKKVKVKAVTNSDNEAPESEVSDDSSDEDDLGECVMLEEGKLKLSAAYAIKMEKEKKEKYERK